MCGRFTLTDPARIKKAFPQFAFEEFSEYRLPRYNIAPTQEVLAVRNDGRNRIEPMRWGFASLAAGPPGGIINARAETLAVRPSFRDAFRSRRCAIFADGFYEWKARHPYRFTLRGGEPFAFAGLWQPEGDRHASCAIVTCEPNELVAAIHDRMPVILAPDALEVWLRAQDEPPEVAAAVLRPYDAAAMEVRAVSMRVNNARHDAPDVLADDAPDQQTFGF